MVIELIKEKETKNNDLIETPVVDGEYFTKYSEFLYENNKEGFSGICSNSRKVISFFKNPDSKKYDPRKILCLGKVQSGKTSFFLGAIALAFDNGYDVAYVLGGTKLKLKSQNKERIKESFKNNEKVKIIEIKEDYEINDLIETGNKVIFIVLKNASKNKNLGILKRISKKFNYLKSIVIDDEGDEYTPGSKKEKGNRTHEDIVESLENFEIVTYLAITATPQANLLLPIQDKISPDNLVLVEPGKNYIGGEYFFDQENNEHIKIIDDKDDFIFSIPDSFKEAFNFFVFAIALKGLSKKERKYSMLVHPSSLNIVQQEIYLKIKTYLDDLKNIFKENSLIKEEEFKKDLNKIYLDFIKNNNINYSFEEIFEYLKEKDILKNIEIRLINKDSEDEEYIKKYNVIVGGNLLGRGLTITDLIVSYIYRDSKIAQVDTMYQRCRWFGYKADYLDVCRVYLTYELQKKFISIVDHESDLWNSLKAFLNSDVDIKNFRRIFKLNYDTNKLVLTRPSVSKTVSTNKIKSSTIVENAIDFVNDDSNNNLSILKDFIKKHDFEKNEVDFDNSKDHRQLHYLYEVSYINFFEEFLSKYKFPKSSKLSLKIFKDILREIERNEKEDKVIVMILRPKFGEIRSIKANSFVPELLQGRNDNTFFSGDRYPVDLNGNSYTDKFYIQIHLVRNKEDNNREKEKVLLVLNNPLSKESISLVTGEFYE